VNYVYLVPPALAVIVVLFIAARNSRSPAP
jgi:hypothetical protein